MSLDYDRIIDSVSIYSALRVKVNAFFRMHFTNKNFVFNNGVRNLFCSEFLDSVDLDKLYLFGISSYFDKMKILFKLTIDVVLNNNFFNHHGNEIYYREGVFCDDSQDGIRFYIYNKLYQFSVKRLYIDPEKDQEFLFNLIYKISIKFFKGSLELRNENCSDLRKLNSEWRWVKKCVILEYLKDNPNSTITEISKKFEIHYNTAKSLFNRFKENPLLNYDDLKEGSRGPKRNLFNVISESILNELSFALVEKVPGDYQLQFSTWTGECIRIFLQKVYKLNVKLSYLYYFLNRNDIYSKFAQRRNPKQDPRKMKEFIDEIYPDLIRLASNYNAKIAFCDETHVLQGYDKKGYAPRGKRTHVTHNQSCRHTKYSLFTVMCPDGFFRSFKIEGTFTSEEFIRCLEILHKENTNTKFIMILDNSHVHNSEEVETWLNKLYKENNVFVRLYFLPKYCPEMNPVEYFNQEFKAHLKGLKLNNEKDVIKATENYLKKYEKSTEEMKNHVRNFFMGEGCSYSLIQIYDFILKNQKKLVA